MAAGRQKAQARTGAMEVNSKTKKVKCYGAVLDYYNNPLNGYGYGDAGNPHVLFFKKVDEITDRSKGAHANYVKNGDVVIEFEEVARYTIQNVGPQLIPIEGKKEAASSEGQAATD